LKVFLDRRCLEAGYEWRRGFLEGLQSAAMFVSLLSAKGLGNFTDPSKDHSADSLLMEFETALEIKTITGNQRFICPLLIGDVDAQGLFSKFQGFNEMIYDDQLRQVSR
jgi:hypothetical protein